MFLVEKDYLTLTKEQVIDTVALESAGITREEIFASCDARAVGEVKSYLNNKYDTDLMFFDIKPWSVTENYELDDYVYYSPEVKTWNSVTAYNTGEHVWYEADGKTYIVTALTSAGDLPTDITKFTETVITRKIYKALSNVPSGTLVSNATFYDQTDPRDAYLVSLCTDVFLYHAMSRIVPRNIPERIGVKYADVISLLRDFADNRKNTHAPFPLRGVDTDDTDGQNNGYDISWGSQTKFDNANDYY